MERQKMKKVKVVQSEIEKEVPAVIIAQSIKRVSDAAESLCKSGLTDHAVILLLSHLAGETQKSVKHILWAMDNLKRVYLK